MKILLTALALSLAAAARAQTWNRLEGQHSGVKENRAVVVRDQQQWRELWSRHDASTPAPEVDFSKENVVAVFGGETPTAGVKIQIVVQDDPIDSDRLNVFYRRTVVKKNGFSARVQCAPYAIVKVPAKKTIDLEADAKVSNPEKTLPPAPKRDERKAKALLDMIGAPSFDGK